MCDLDGGDPRSLDGQARTISTTGHLLALQGRTDEALADFRDVVEIRKKLTDRQPSQPRWHHKLAEAPQQFADLTREADQAAEARRQSRDALRRAKELEGRQSSKPVPE